MGHFWSKRLRPHRQEDHHDHHPPPPPPPSAYSSSSVPPPPPLPPPPTTAPSVIPPFRPPPPPPPTAGFAANSPYPVPAPDPYFNRPLSPPLVPPSYYSYHNHATLSPPPPRPSTLLSQSALLNLLTGQPSSSNVYFNSGPSWAPYTPAVMPQHYPVATMPLPQPVAVAPYVDHQSAKRVKNDVNVHRDTIKLVVDEMNKDSVLVSFTFDALVDGRITICYFAKEGEDCKFDPYYPELYAPMTMSFQKGLGQKFCQPSGTGVDLGFCEINDLAKPLSGEDVFPLVICAESCPPSTLEADQRNEQRSDISPCAQITQAIIEKDDEDKYQVKVVKQILWIDGVRYELREIFGISNVNETVSNDKDSGIECVICMTEPKDTAVLPCRHMCMCSECAKELRLQSDRCPICRQPIEELIEIKVAEGND